MAISLAIGNFGIQNPAVVMCEMKILFQSEELKKHFE